MVGWPLGRSFSQWVGRSVGQSIDWSDGRSVCLSVCLSVGRSVCRPVCRSVGLSVGRSAGLLFDRSVGRQQFGEFVECRWISEILCGQTSWSSCILDRKQSRKNVNKPTHTAEYWISFNLILSFCRLQSRWGTEPLMPYPARLQQARSATSSTYLTAAQVGHFSPWPMKC